jgi:hypothetical protein
MADLTDPRVERFGKARQDWLKRFLTLDHGIPTHDTFNRVFAALDRKAFAAGFGRGMADLAAATGLRAVAIDGKAVRSAPGDTFSGCLRLVSAWAVENGLILGQEAVADGSHEIAAIPELLTALDLKGALVTLDAAGCQTAIAGQIRAQGGDYLLAVKGNQPALRRAVHAAVVPGDGGFVVAGHGRRHSRGLRGSYWPPGSLPRAHALKCRAPTNSMTTPWNANAPIAAISTVLRSMTGPPGDARQCRGPDHGRRGDSGLSQPTSEPRHSQLPPAAPGPLPPSARTGAPGPRPGRPAVRADGMPGDRGGLSSGRGRRGRGIVCGAGWPGSGRFRLERSAGGRGGIEAGGNDRGPRANPR